MTNIGLANIATRFVLAPLERWRIIKQTQIAYPLRPVAFKNSIDYISSIFISIKEFQNNKDFLHFGEEILQESGFILRKQ
jgi:hypothetical protein